MTQFETLSDYKPQGRALLLSLKLRVKSQLESQITTLSFDLTHSDYKSKGRAESYTFNSKSECEVSIRVSNYYSLFPGFQSAIALTI